MSSPLSADRRTPSGRLEAVLDTVALAIVVSDEQGLVVYANRHAGRLLGDRLEGGRGGREGRRSSTPSTPRTGRSSERHSTSRSIRAEPPSGVTL